MFTKKEFPDVKTAVKRVKFEKFAVGDASGRGVLCGTGGGNCDCSGGKIAPCVGLTDYLLPSGGNPSIPNPHDPPAVFALLPGTDENGERTERVAFVSKRGLAYLYNDTRQEFEYAMRVFDSTPKILPVYAADGGAKLAFCSSEGILLFDGDSKFSSVYARGSDAACVFHERLFFAEKPFTLRYSAPLDASMFADSADEGGYIRLPSTGGEIVGLEEWKESIYIFRERGIEKLNAKGAARDFSHETLSYGGGKIFGRSIGKCGKNILFLAEDGVYAFDGYDAVKVGKEFPLAKDKRETCAGYLENKYYLACKVDEFGGDGNNAVVRYDTETKDVSVLSGVRVSSLCAVKTSNGADLICTFQDGNKNKLGMMSESGKIFDTATQKVYKSPETMLGYPLSKTVRGASIFTKYPIELDVIFDGKRYAFNVEGSDMQRYVPIEKCGVRIAFEIKTAQQNAHIAPMFVDVDVERSRL